MSSTEYSVDFLVSNIQMAQIFKDDVESRHYLRSKRLLSRDTEIGTNRGGPVYCPRENNFSHIVIDRGYRLMLRCCSQ